MSYVDPGLVLYLRPIAAIQPYRIAECALWLVEIGEFKNYTDARSWLNYVEDRNPNQFRHVMSLYFNNNITRYIPPKRDVNKYHENWPSERYGEPHMY